MSHPMKGLFLQCHLQTKVSEEKQRRKMFHAVARASIVCPLSTKRCKEFYISLYEAVHLQYPSPEELRTSKAFPLALCPYRSIM